MKLKIGDGVRLTAMPQGIAKDLAQILQKCVGNSFQIVDINENEMVKLEIGPAQTVWVNPDCLELVGLP